MTLAIQRPERKYDTQTILEANDVHGLLKHLDQAITQKGEAGEYETAYYVGAYIAVSILTQDRVERWTDFMRAFKEALELRSFK